MALKRTFTYILAFPVGPDLSCNLNRFLALHIPNLKLQNVGIDMVLQLRVPQSEHAHRENLRN
jgi:hypothetical protein